MGLFGNSGVVGLEFDTGLIRAVEIKGNSSTAKIIAAGQMPIPETAVVDGVVQESDAVVEALGKLWSKARISSRNVVLGMFNQSVIMRLINFPKVPRDKLEQALRLQVGDYFPIPLSQMIMDFDVIGEINGDEGEQYEVLLVAARKAQLEHSLDALKKSKLISKVVDASPLAMTRVLSQEKLSGTTVLVDLSMGLSSIVLVMNGMPRFARVMPVSLRQYIGSFGASLDQEYHQYVAATLEKGINKELFVKWGTVVADEIRTSISYYVRQDNLSDVDRIILSGQGARVIGLHELLQEQLDISVEVVQPLANVKVNKKLGIDVNGPEFAVSVGLALRGLEV
jgi:type IV pilus assembly protein PilM